MTTQADLESYAAEIADVVAEYFVDDSLMDNLTEFQRNCVYEIGLSTSITFERIVELWNASGLTY